MIGFLGAFSSQLAARLLRLCQKYNGTPADALVNLPALSVYGSYKNAVGQNIRCGCHCLRGHLDELPSYGQLMLDAL